MPHADHADADADDQAAHYLVLTSRGAPAPLCRLGAAETAPGTDPAAWSAGVSTYTTHAAYTTCHECLDLLHA